MGWARGTGVLEMQTYASCLRKDWVVKNLHSWWLWKTIFTSVCVQHDSSTCMIWPSMCVIWLILVRRIWNVREKLTWVMSRVNESCHAYEGATPKSYAECRVATQDARNRTLAVPERSKMALLSKDGHLPWNKGRKRNQFQWICMGLVAPRGQRLGEHQRHTTWWARHRKDTANDHLVKTCLY